MKKTTLIPVTVLLTSLALGGVYGWQSAGVATSEPQPPKAPRRPNPFGVSATFQNIAAGGNYTTRVSQRTKLQKAIKAIRTAKDDETKRKATKELTDVLGTVFDGDLKRREKEIADIEARVKELKNILDKRRSARDRIIELQIRVLMNEAEGLGFPIRSSRSRYGGGASNPLFNVPSNSGSFRR